MTKIGHFRILHVIPLYKMSKKVPKMAIFALFDKTTMKTARKMAIFSKIAFFAQKGIIKHPGICQKMPKIAVFHHFEVKKVVIFGHF